MRLQTKIDFYTMPGTFYIIIDNKYSSTIFVWPNQPCWVSMSVMYIVLYHAIENRMYDILSTTFKETNSDKAVSY